ncbi:peptide deformylase [Isorropodon fossajaponicum symbiont]|uniref:peptide deformylase n=1 Tax=Isorropodon fossajaponicum symbiont TaxID=883811 RepID=UPI0019165B45|nr:peptide deformylase [Isorropodon fossajaponicum symbiont]
MMILPILNYPDKRLRTKAKHVDVVDKTIQTLIKDMFETMYAKDGIGLAATQVDQHLQVVVIDVPDSQDDYQFLLKNCQKDSHKQPQKHHPLCFINPKIKEKDGQEKHIEGCLSVLDFQAGVQRSNHIKVEALNEKGEVFTLQATGLLAICIQHELDHLKGILFIDYLSKLKQKRLLEKTKKMIKG